MFPHIVCEEKFDFASSACPRSGFLNFFPMWLHLLANKAADEIINHGNVAPAPAAAAAAAAAAAHNVRKKFEYSALKSLPRITLFLLLRPSSCGLSSFVTVEDPQPEFFGDCRGSPTGGYKSVFVLPLKNYFPLQHLQIPWCLNNHDSFGALTSSHHTWFC